MRFDWTITAGTVLHLLGLVAAGFALFYKLQFQILRVEQANLDSAQHIRNIQEDLREIRKELITSLDNRLRALEIQIGGMEKR